MTTLQRRRKIIRYLKKRNYAYPRLTLMAVVATKINLAEALVLLQKESGGGRNVFGCDYGNVGDRPPYCGQTVTMRRVLALKRSGLANGVGPTQLTFRGFWTMIEAWRPFINMRKGFSIFRGYRRTKSVWQAALAYNGGTAYANDFKRRLSRMQASLKRAGI